MHKRQRANKAFNEGNSTISCKVLFKFIICLLLLIILIYSCSELLVRAVRSTVQILLRAGAESFQRLCRLYWDKTWVLVSLVENLNNNWALKRALPWRIILAQNWEHVIPNLGNNSAPSFYNLPLRSLKLSWLQFSIRKNYSFWIV